MYNLIFFGIMCGVGVFILSVMIGYNLAHKNKEKKLPEYISAMYLLNNDPDGWDIHYNGKSFVSTQHKEAKINIHTLFSMYEDKFYIGNVQITHKGLIKEIKEKIKSIHKSKYG